MLFSQQTPPPSGNLQGAHGLLCDPTAIEHHHRLQPPQKAEQRPRQRMRVEKSTSQGTSLCEETEQTGENTVRRSSDANWEMKGLFTFARRSPDAQERAGGQLGNRAAQENMKILQKRNWDIRNRMIQTAQNSKPQF